MSAHGSRLASLIAVTPRILPVLLTLSAVSLGQGPAPVQPGWPLPSPTPGSAGSALPGYTAPKLADMDGDGILDVVTVGYDAQVYVLSGAGEALADWPFPLGYYWTDDYVRVGDVDGDGEMEVVLGVLSGWIYVFEADGTIKDGWPLQLAGDISTFVKNIALGDVDGDGAEEIVCTGHGPVSTETHLYIHSGNGEPLPGWPVIIPTGIAYLRVGDVDFDGIDEIVTSSMVWPIGGSVQPSPVYLFNGDGTVRPGWPATPSDYWPGQRVLRQPVIADLDGDLECEIIGHGRSAVYTFNADGTTHHWPYTTGWIYSECICADLEGDGQVEIVVPTSDLLVIRDGEGIIASTASAEYSFYQGASAADIDGDGLCEFAVWSSSSTSSTGVNVALHVLDDDLQDLPGWPVEYLQPTYPTLDTDLGDIDGDGDAELVHLFPDGVLAWDLERPGTEPVRLEWPMAGHDARNGSDYHADQPLPLPSFLRGDARRDGELDLADPFAFFTELFEGGSDPCPARLDFDADGTLALDDGVALLAWLFLDGPPPDTGPFPACGPIPDGELLPCALDHCF